MSLYAYFDPLWIPSSSESLNFKGCDSGCGSDSDYECDSDYYDYADSDLELMF